MAKIPRGKKGVVWLLQQPSAYDVVLTVTAVPGMASSAYQNYAAENYLWASMLALGALLILVLTGAKHWVKLQE